jgi:hypothetical protein
MIRMMTTIPGMTIVAPSGRAANAVMRLDYPLPGFQPLLSGQTFELGLGRRGIG